ncbi:hypothetical protein LUZ62_026081 [Rhynchospora pubera]|uniref:Glycosyltransferase 61 catalytic domain-containing protein n=1 Tax=Rhynchospora pubera TaxID=906938 RepID=A0AAV8H6Q0_9POAL|nr:hypothetical protein LUZ62_026081 [Rhynchospora pubera]
MSTSITISLEKSSKIHAPAPKTVSFPNNSSLKHSLFLVTLFIFLLLFIQFKALQSPLHFSWPLLGSQLSDQDITSMLRDSVTFLPLKDLRFSKEPESGHTWFMSSINDTFEPNESEYLYFPSNSSKGRLLCFSAHDPHDGAKNSYAFAWREALPHGAILLPGLTYVSDTYYDHGNLWHGLNAIAPFIAWNIRKGCVAPARWVLFHWGELRTEMGKWVNTIAEVAIGKAEIETFKGIEGPTCFEEAVVFRHNHGAMSKARVGEVYDRIRCKAREFCKVGMDKIRDKKDVQMTLFLRTGARSFKNESVVVSVFEEECRKAGNCRVKVEKTDNLSFCDQVRLMSETDILVTPHGAQMTNILFMERNSSVMEFYPKGWEDLAGVGQYVYKWLSDWAGMRHQGVWRDPEGPPCPDPSDKLQCFFDFKDRQIGHDTVYFSKWASKVLQDMKEHRQAIPVKGNDLSATRTNFCQCGTSV